MIQFSAEVGHSMRKNIELIWYLNEIKIKKIFKALFYFLNESRRIQLWFATNRIQISPLETEIQPVKGMWRHYCGSIKSRGVIGLTPVTIITVSFITFFPFLTLEVHLQDSKEISGAQLPYRRRERRRFVCVIIAVL